MVLCPCCYAQISPPGLGEAKTASWFALGLRQSLDTAGKWQSMSYIGLGRKSNPDNYAPLYKPSILVINQEFYHQFRPQWQYSFAFSFRTQDEYQDEAPYNPTEEKHRREFRIYGRMVHSWSRSKVKFTSTFRQELRAFKDPNLRITDDLQLRSRLKFQMAVHLDAEKIHRIMAGAESLFSLSKRPVEGGWTAFGYQESRFTLYYTLVPHRSPLMINLGYMYDLVGSHAPFSVHYVAMDVILENPFRLLKK